MQDRQWAGLELKLENAKFHFRRTCTVLLAAVSLMSSPPPAWSQNAIDWWQAGGRPAVLRLRDCIAAYADHETHRTQNEKPGALLIAAIEGDCRSAFDELIQLFSQHIDANEIELQLRTITDTTLLPALKGSRGYDRSTAYSDKSPLVLQPDPLLTRRIVMPENASNRRALKSPVHADRGPPPKFSPKWLANCHTKYHSFNPRTGKYRSYRGVYRTCR
jgi:BA14K-like protein